METCDFSLFCRWHVKDTAPEEMVSNKQRKGGGEIRRLVNISVLSVLYVVKVLKNMLNYGIIIKNLYC